MKYLKSTYSHLIIYWNKTYEIKTKLPESSYSHQIKHTRSKRNTASQVILTE